MSNIITVSEVERMANAVAKSGLFGVKNVEQAMALMLIAQAEGMHPAIAARDFHVIQGRPALKADAMLARFQAAGSPSTPLARCRLPAIPLAHHRRAGANQANIARIAFRYSTDPRSSSAGAHSANSAAVIGT